MKKIFFDCGTRDLTASFGILVLRLFTGLMMLLGHGLPKIRNYEKLKGGWHVPDFFPLKFMSPPVSLIATIGAEVAAAVLIAVGLATRPAAFVLGFAMVVAAFDVLHAAPWFVAPPDVLVAKELSLLYLGAAVVILLTGAGGLSLDAVLHKDGKRRRW